MIKTQTIAIIDKSFRSLIQKQNYEKYVQIIINKSQKIFRNLEFIPVEDQSHGESDFIDNNGQKYEAKLLFDERQGALIGDSKNNINEWIQEMLKEKIEFSESIRKRDALSLSKTRFYKIMKERLATVEQDENAIFFIPFPIVDEFEGSIFIQFATDFIQAVYERLVDDGLVGNRQVFFIYPSGDSHKYMLRNSNRIRECIACEELDDFIKYETRYVME